MQVKQLMKQGSDFATCSPTDCVAEAVAKMKGHRVGWILVAEKDRLKGILTDRDIVLAVFAQGKDARKTRLEEILEVPVVSGGPEWDVLEATRVMSENGLCRLPIQSKGKLQGFVTLADLVPVLQDELDFLLSTSALKTKARPLPPRVRNASTADRATGAPVSQRRRNGKPRRKITTEVSQNF